MGSNDCELEFSCTYQIMQDDPGWYITLGLYHLENPEKVYEVVVKARFPAAFLNPATLSGNIIDLQIACTKALFRHSKKTMVTKSLPMELLYALSPRTGISDALKFFGFRPVLANVLVVWIHSTPLPPEESVRAFEEAVASNGRKVALAEMETLSDAEAVALVYDFPKLVPGCESSKKSWKSCLHSYVTSKIAIKE